MFYSARPMLSRLLLVFCLSAASLAASAQAPTAVDDSYSVNVNGLLTVPAASGLLSNDTGFNAATHRLESTSAVSQYGARLTIGADGAFSYDPPAGFSGIDTFAYTVRSAGGAAAAVVNVDVTGQSVWFVDDSAAAGGDGSFGAPFNSLSLVNGANGVGDIDAAGDTIFVYAGNYSVEFDLEPGQQLIGESNGLDLIGTGNDIAPGVRPTLNASSTFPIIEFFGANGTARGFNINSTAGTALQGASVSNVTIAQVTVTASAGSNNGILFNGSSATNTFDNVDITGTAGTGSAIVLLNNSGTINFVDSGVSSFTGAYVLNVNGNSGTISFDSTSDLSSSNTRGLTIQTQTATGVVNLAGVNLAGGAASEPLVRLQSNHADSTVNFLEGVTASATTTDSAAFLSDGGQLAISGSGSTLSAADGAALYLESVTLTQNATFASLSSTSAPARGISIDSPIGNNDVIVSGSTSISTPTTEAIRVNSTAASGFLLQLATLNSTGGTIGIAVTNAAVTVSNNASTLVTSAGPAVVCATGTANLALTTLTAAGGTTGVSFDGCAGTVNAANGTLNSTAGAGNPVVNLVNTAGISAVNFTYGGSINKTTSGAAVNIVGLTTPGAATFNGTVTGTNASGGVVITNTTRSVTFTTLILGDSTNRFVTTPVTLAGNTGAVDLGVLSVYTNGATALNINYANASPGQITTDAGSLLNVAGAARALAVSHATSQSLSLQFTDIINPGAGTHGIDINRATGALVVTGLVNLGAKTTAGVQISNSNNLVVSIDELDITGAADGVRLSNNTGGSFTILGDGNFVSSHTNGAGGTFTNLTDNAFDLSNVVDFRATDVTVNGTGGHGVTGTGVSGTTVFSNVDFSNIGNADNEHVFNFQEGAVSGAQVSGTLEINNSVIENFTDNGMYLENFAGTLNLRWTDNTLRNNITTAACGGDNCNGNGILLRADGTSRINAFIQNSVFEDIDGLGLTANPEGNSGARMDLAVVTSAFTAEPYAGASNTNNGETAISLRNAQGNSTLNFRLFSNDIRNYSGELALGVVEIEGGDFTTTQGVIDTLYIYQAHLGNALQIFADGANTNNALSTTNFTMNVSMNAVNVPATTPIFGASILLQNNGAISGSTANSNFVVTNSNLLANATGTARRTLTMNARDFNNVCNRIEANTIAAGTGGTQPSVNLSYNGSGTVRLQGMSGSGDANAISYLGANNTLSVAASSGPNNNITSATCTTPTLPVAFPFN